MKKLLALAVVILGFTAVSFGQVSATATASATIVSPIAIVNAGNLNFGNVATSNALGTVTIDPAGTRSSLGGVTLPATVGTVGAAHFTVSGTTDYTYSISAIAPIQVDFGAFNMVVDNFVTTPTPTGKLTGGSETINVGATLHVAANQNPGLYVSTVPFKVTVNYN